MIQPAFTSFIDLASERLGGKAISCSDDFFAPVQNLLKQGRGVFIEDKYTDRGKWMDGWESRRKRTSGNDWCVIKLAATGVIKGLDVDTNHFFGNHPPHCSVQACYSENDDFEKTGWSEILAKSPLIPGSRNLFEINCDKKFTHVKLNIYPDGGVARFRVYGEVKKNLSLSDTGKMVDLAAAVNGAKSILCSDMFFSHIDNLIMPGRGINMGDGWETKRSRTPGNNDWVIIRLASKGIIEKITVDTFHFKGNYPDSCLIEGCISETDNIENATWSEILPQSKLSAHTEHHYQSEIENKGPFTHARLSIFPDGGISRLRLWGIIK